MIRSILVPMDGSPFGDRALPLAFALAQFHSARVALATVHTALPPSRTQGAPVIDPAFDNDRRASAAQHLDRAVSLARDVGCRDPQRFLLDGEVLDRLEVFVRDYEIDLVVMSTHGRGGAARAWLGSVAEGLLRRVSVPVLLTRVKHRMPERGERLVPFSRVLVALDGSAVGEHIVDEVIRLMGSAPVHVTLAHVIQPAQTALSPLVPSAIDAEVREHFLEPIASRIRSEGGTASVHVVVHGHAARALVALARSEQSDLIALSTHGHRSLQRLLLGNVADKIIRSSPVPVLVCRRQEDPR